PGAHAPHDDAPDDEEKPEGHDPVEQEAPEEVRLDPPPEVAAVPLERLDEGRIRDRGDSELPLDLVLPLLDGLPRRLALRGEPGLEAVPGDVPGSPALGGLGRRVVG